MKKSARKSLAGLPVPLFLLVFLLTSAPRALSQQPAPKTAATAVQTGQGTRVTETAVDASIPDDPPVDKMLAVYSPKVHELEVVIGRLKGELKKSGAGSGSLG